METVIKSFKHIFSRSNILVIVFIVTYFALTLYHPTQYTVNYQEEQQGLFFLIQTFCFITIFSGFFGIKFIIEKLKEKNEKYITYTKYFLLFLILQIFLIYITKPFAISSHDYCWIMTDFTDINYIRNIWVHIIPIVYSAVSNSIFMSVYGTSIMSSILYSLVFVFFIDTVKNRISKKYWTVCLPLFLMPNALVWNLVQYRQIYAAWLFLFLFIFLFRYKNKQINNYGIAVFIGCLTGILTAIRSENIFLLFIIPTAIFSLKIFTKRKFLICLFPVLFILLGVNFIQKKIENGYSIHNLSPVLGYYLDNNIQLDYCGYEDKFRYVFPGMNKNNENEHYDPFFDDYNLKNEAYTKEVKYCLIKMGINQSFNLSKKHITELYTIDTPWILFDEPQYKNYRYIIKNYPNKQKIIENIIYENFENKVAKILKTYNIFSFLFLICFIVCYSLFIKNRFYIYSSLSVITILIPALIFMPYGGYYYLYPAIFCTWALFYMILIENIEKIKNNNRSDKIYSEFN